MPGRAHGVVAYRICQFRAPVIPHPASGERHLFGVGKPLGRSSSTRPSTEYCRLTLAVVLSSKPPAVEFSCVEKRARTLPSSRSTVSFMPCGNVGNANSPHAWEIEGGQSVSLTGQHRPVHIKVLGVLRLQEQWMYAPHTLAPPLLKFNPARCLSTDCNPNPNPSGAGAGRFLAEESGNVDVAGNFSIQVRWAGTDSRRF